MTYRRLATLALALLLDLVLGDPPNRYHPVAWLGQGIGWAEQRAPRGGRWRPFLYGLGLSVGGAVAVAALARRAEWLTDRLLPLGIVVQAWLLKATFSVRSLTRAAFAVQTALERGDLPEARRLLSWHLVSRDTSSLDASLVAAATVESVAENTGDGFVAPVLYYTLFGLPGAWAYRFLNTGDAMLGYRDPRHEWLGKAPARLDDLANLLPSRLTAALLMLAAAWVGEDAPSAWRIWRRDAGQTASPNAGQPMSTMAGALGVELEKVGHYRLGAGLRRPTPSDIARAVHLMRRAAGLMSLLTAALLALRRK